MKLHTIMKTYFTQEKIEKSKIIIFIFIVILQKHIINFMNIFFINEILIFI